MLQMYRAIAYIQKWGDSHDVFEMPQGRDGSWAVVLP
jgi:hypothetical protein